MSTSKAKRVHPVDSAHPGLVSMRVRLETPAAAAVSKCRRRCLCRRDPTRVLEVAGDPGVACDVLEKLTRCANAAVRAAVINNPRSTGRELRPLLRSPSPGERVIAVYRCSGYIPWRVFRRVARRDPDQAVRRAALKVLVRHYDFQAARQARHTAAECELRQQHRSTVTDPTEALHRFHALPQNDDPSVVGRCSGSGFAEPVTVHLNAGEHVVKFRLCDNIAAAGMNAAGFDAVLVGIDHPDTVRALTTREDINDGTWTEPIHVAENSTLPPGRYEMLVSAHGGGDWTATFTKHPDSYLGAPPRPDARGTGVGMLR